MKSAKPWIEPGLYAECPWCGDSNILESDESVSLPDESFEHDCENCGKTFVVEGTNP